MPFEQFSPDTNRRRRPFVQAMATVTFALVFNMWAIDRGMPADGVDDITALLMIAGMLLFIAPEIEGTVSKVWRHYNA